MPPAHQKSLWNYLKSAELVVQIQQWFGVFRVKNTVAGASNGDPKHCQYVIKNRFWYYLFCIGAASGDEGFYAALFPFWFWNVDGAVGRRMVMVWAISMYIGQGLKDIIRWPRPSSPPVVRLEEKWALEYGMPSTHAMVAAAVPFSILFYTANRYQYSVFIGVIAAVIWCTIVCTSRFYLGMHTVLDVLAGLCLTILILFPLIPLADWLDHFVLTDDYAIFAIWSTALVLVVYYPISDRWTPARGDTTTIIAVCAGVQSGAWTCYQLGLIRGPPLDPPYAIIWPTYEMLGLTILRTVIGMCVVMASRAIFKWASYATLCAIMHLDAKDLAAQEYSLLNRHKIRVEISYKFITYAAIGFNAVCLSPIVFRIMGIERPTFYTEV